MTSEALELIKNLAIIYGSTTVSSLVFNKFYFRDRNKMAFDKSKRKLKYRDLSLDTCYMLDNVRAVYKLADKVSIFLSTVPVINVIYTVDNIMASDKKFSTYFDDKIDEINKKETSIRKSYLKQIQEAKVIPESIKSKLEDEEYLPNEEDFREVMSANAPRMVLKITRHKKD